MDPNQPAATPTPPQAPAPPTPIAEGIPEKSPDIIGRAATETPVMMPKSAFAEKKPTKKTNPAILLVLTFVLLAALGAAAYFLFLR